MKFFNIECVLFEFLNFTWNLSYSIKIFYKPLRKWYTSYILLKFRNVMHSKTKFFCASFTDVFLILQLSNFIRIIHKLYLQDLNLKQNFSIPICFNLFTNIINNVIYPFLRIFFSPRNRPTTSPQVLHVFFQRNCVHNKEENHF